MPTLLHRLSYAHGPSAGIAPVPISDEELSLMADDSLLNWWRADVGFSSLGWECRKTSKRLVPERDAMPTLQPELAAYNAQPSLLFSDSTQLWDNGESLCPTGGDFTLVAVGRAGTEDSAFLVGGAGSGTTRTMITHQSTAIAGGTVRFSVNNDGGTIGNYSVVSDGAYYFADGPNLIVGSHAPGDVVKQGLGINGVNKTGNPPAAGVANVDGELHVGGVNIHGEAISGGLTGDLAEVLVFNSALHLRPDQLDLLERYINARYGLW